MFSDRRRLGIFVIGLGAFLQLWAIQALLPTLARYFAASEAQVGLTVSATTLAVTITAPFVGVIADVLGRRRMIVIALFGLIVPTALIGVAQNLDQIVALRFIQGLLLPPVFAVAIAYIGDEFPRESIAAVTATYTTGSVLGGFLGRFLAGWIGEFGGWRLAFITLAALSLICAAVVMATLPRERRFVRAEGVLHSMSMMARHFRDPRLVATFAVGFGVLFCFVTLFTYINFYLAAPPFDLSAGWLGSLFVSYAFGIVTTPLAGPLVARMGRRGIVLCVIGSWAAGLLLTLIPHVLPIFIGLVVCACSGFICQTVSTGYVAFAATQARSSAVGLYVTFYYLGGSVGAIIGGVAWHRAGWLGCVVLVWLMMAVMIACVLRFWYEPAAQTQPS
ncbi:MAG TPA: MFS transporter [Stellaceae bacterium]|jgi:predicted MFS family arabinose efflux permease|nr:MFS transporter [Stellaceae bacterium]